MATPRPARPSPHAAPARAPADAGTPPAPDYDLAPTVVASTPDQLRALADPARRTILDLVLDRAATVTELAVALDRPRSSVAYHVDVLVGAGLLIVVRTRKVRAIEERFYGRTGRTIEIRDSDTPPDLARHDFLAEARAEALAAATEPDSIWSTMHHARIPRERADEFIEAVAELSDRFTRLPHDGDVVYGFVAAVYRTNLPRLPEPTT